MSEQIIAIDLGARSTKAVCLEKDGPGVRLVSYTIQDRPDFGKTLSRDSLAKHFSALIDALNPKTRNAILVVGAGDSLICHADMPAISASEMRKMVKLNPKLYFQEDMPNYSFDCLVLHQEGTGKMDPKQARKARALVVGVKNQLLRNLQSGADAADLDVEQVTASQTGAANCFLMSPEAALKKVIALVDIGFSNSTISLLDNGEITLTRVINIGADKFTSGLAEAMNITYSVAEGLKQIMPEKVTAQLKTLIAPLSNELSNSIHFFEQQYQDKKVTDVFVSGGSARSKFIVEILESELHLPCKSWDPTAALKLKLTSAQTAALQQEAAQLTVAIGAGLTWFKEKVSTIDLLSEQKEEAELRSRDPMKRGYLAAGALVSLMLAWYAATVFHGKHVLLDTEEHQTELKRLQENFVRADAIVKGMTAAENTLRVLDEHSHNRFLFAPALNALQYTVVDNFQVSRLEISQSIAERPGLSDPAKKGKSAPSVYFEKTVFTIQARSFAKPSAAESFMRAIEESPWFSSNLREERPIRLTESQAAQTDAYDPDKIIIPFTVECYAERNL